jgi:N-dimethylarginine dimethylaminohydrolase
MDENWIIDQLEELIKSFGVQIRREPIKQDEDLVNVVGGLCLLRGEYVLIINSKATTMDRIKTLATALKHFDLDQIYLRPVLRELLDKIPEQSPFNLIDKQKLKDFP